MPKEQPPRAPRHAIQSTQGSRATGAVQHRSGLTDLQSAADASPSVRSLHALCTIAAMPETVAQMKWGDDKPKKTGSGRGKGKRSKHDRKAGRLAKLTAGLEGTEVETDVRSVSERVRDAIDRIKTEDLGKETIMAALRREFTSYEDGLHEATRDPTFSETLLNQIQKRQSKSWQAATKRQEVPQVAWENDDLASWNVRHYTNKVIVTLGEHMGKGIYAVGAVRAPSFTEILSTASLATLPAPPDTEGAQGPAEGGQLMLANTSGASSSGHTTMKDWVNIGNVGDTFYGLFYKNEPATGITPNFIKDATYYAQWSVEEFGIGWASADWLGTASDSMKEDGNTPGGIARTGDLGDIIAAIYPEATTRDARGRDEPDKEARKSAFAAMSNFEIKKHGPMTVGTWIEVTANTSKMSNYWVDTTKGNFIKNAIILKDRLK